MAKMTKRQVEFTKRYVLTIILLVLWGMFVLWAIPRDKIDDVEPDIVAAQTIDVLVSPNWPQEDPGSGEVLVVCQLHKGGSEGLVDVQVHRIKWGENLNLKWEVDGLASGWYETHCQLTQGNQMLTKYLKPVAQRIQSHQYAPAGNFLYEEKEILLIYLPVVRKGAK